MSYRLDAVIPFVPLNPIVVSKVVDKFIRGLQAQLADKGVKLELSVKARKYLSERGHDNQQGARPLERIINEEVKRALADEILFGKLMKGGRVNIDCLKGKLSFSFKNDACVQ